MITAAEGQDYLLGNGDNGRYAIEFQGNGLTEFKGYSYVDGYEGWGYVPNLESQRQNNSWLGLLHFDDMGNISIPATNGSTSFDNHQLTEDDIDARNTGVSVAIGTMAAPFNPVIGIATTAISAYYSRRMSALPGLSVGDNELTVSSFEPSGSPGIIYGSVPMTPGVHYGCKYTFRNGQMIAQDGFSWPAYIPN